MDDRQAEPMDAQPMDGERCGRLPTVVAIAVSAVGLSALMGATFSIPRTAQIATIQLFLALVAPATAFAGALVGWPLARQFGRPGALGLLRSVVVGLTVFFAGSFLAGVAVGVGAGLIEVLSGVSTLTYAELLRAPLEFGVSAVMIVIEHTLEKASVFGVAVLFCIGFVHLVGERQHAPADYFDA